MIGSESRIIYDFLGLCRGMNLYLNRFLIALAASSKLQDLLLALELLILGLELLKLCIKSLCQFLHHSLPLSAATFAHNVVDARISGSSIRVTYLCQIPFVLGTELLWLYYSSLAEDTAPECNFRRGL